MEDCKGSTVLLIKRLIIIIFLRKEIFFYEQHLKLIDNVL